LAIAISACDLREMNKTICLGLVSLGCAAFGLLLIFEVIRPFRDLAKDGPLAMISWSVGAIVALKCFFGRHRSRAVAIIGLSVNLIPMLMLTALLFFLGHSNLAWH
jgi:hypothetical protein